MARFSVNHNMVLRTSGKKQKFGIVFNFGGYRFPSDLHWFCGLLAHHDCLWYVFGSNSILLVKSLIYIDRCRTRVE